MKKIYLDYAASTPVDSRVARAMQPYFAKHFGNPGSLHSFGQAAIAAVDRSRETIGKAIGAEFREAIFTGSATEANNLALRGAYKAAREKNIERPRIIISAIEHESVLETARDLEREGAEIVYVLVDDSGIVEVSQLKAALNDRTAIVSIMYANNEIGSIQPIVKIAEVIREYKEDAHVSDGIFPLFHTDAAQAFQFLDCNAHTLGVDMMTISAHKIYGPKGIGALYIKDKARSLLHPLIMGGGQEFGLRSGTENVASIVGFAKAVELAVTKQANEVKRITELRDHFWRALKKIIPDVEHNPSNFWFPSLPNILNIYIPGHAAQDILTKLDLSSVAASSGSACRSRAMESSYVIEALGYSKQRAVSSIRISFGRSTRKKDINAALRIIKKALSK